MSELENARKTINEVDKKIAELFVERMKAGEIIAKYKREHGLSILDRVREAELIARNSQMIKDDVLREYYIEYLKDTMRISRAYQSRLNEGMKVAYSGVVGAYAYIAAEKMYPEAILVAYNDFESAYRSVENGECDACVLPVENSYAGDVGNVMDLLFSGSLYVNQVHELAINHCLMVKEDTDVSKIKRVYSHPQALEQCADYISKHGYEPVTYSNTATAAQYVSESSEEDIAAIASEETAEIFGLKIVESKINASRTNTTRFVSFSRALNTLNPSGRKMNEHFMLVFTVRDEAGALAKTIDIIGAFGFNMRNLRSRPMKELLWSYYFFVEADGNINSENGKEMLRALGATCDRLKLVGTYTLD